MKNFASTLVMISLLVSPLNAGDWEIDSPADGAGPFNNNTSISCNGETDDVNQEWECRIKQTGVHNSINQNSVSGTSTEDDGDYVWSGTVSYPGTGWWPLSAGADQSATVTLTDLDTDDIEDTHTISFKHHGS